MNRTSAQQKICSPSLLIFGIFFFLCSFSFLQAKDLKPENPQWNPIEDDIYLQEVSLRIKTEEPVLCVALLKDKLYVSTASGVSVLRNEELIPVENVTTSFQKMAVLQETLWGIGEKEIWNFSGETWNKAADISASGICLHLGKVIVSSGSHLYEINGSEPVQIDKKGRDIPILGIVSHNETLYVRHSRGLGIFLDDEFQYFHVQDWGHLPLGSETTDQLSLGNQLLVSTNKGIGILRGMSWHPLTGNEGLCYEDVTCLAPGFNRDYWIGTSRGAIRAVDGEYHYFGYERWIPNDKVNDIACGNNTAYIATDGGLGIIQYEPFTLRKKAAWYSRWLNEYGHKRIGFVHRLSWDSKTKQYVRFISDNDVGWTGSYLNSLCYEYAVTGDEEVRKEAVDVFKTMKWSEEITPIKGFPARSIATVGSESKLSTTGSGGLPSEWNRTDDGLWDWKGDTSSDEIDVHVSSTALFLELVARGKEIDAAKEHLDRVVGHIVDNGWVLRDLDGKPTRWGRWDPEYLQRPYGFMARGLNGMEAINFVTTAYHFTGNPKFKQGKKQLLDWEYHHQTLRQKLVFPFVTSFDDRLAFLAYFPLLQYEKDPSLRSIVIRSLDRAWEVKRIEQVAWFNFTYGALTGNDCETEEAVDSLRLWPLSCFDYKYTNSHRADLHVIRNYKNYTNDWKPMTPREYGVHWLDNNPQKLDGGGGKSINDPSGWLESYWMGRYFGMIKAPTTKEENLLTVEKRNFQAGAKPYSGPARPKLKNPF